MLEQPHLAALITSSENLGITITGLTAVLLANAFDILSLPIGAALLGYATFRYSKVSAERNDILQFDGLRDKTQSRINELRVTANDDAQLAQWWRAYFEQEPPFV